MRTPHLIVLHIDHHSMPVRGVSCLLCLRKSALRLLRSMQYRIECAFGRCYISIARQTKQGLLFVIGLAHLH
jgi:hypothetical protein